MLRMGMVGGGPGAFIGPVHRMAAELDGHIRLVAGAFSSDAGRSAQAGRDYGIDQDRAYPDWRTMIAAEAGRPDGIDMVAIVTPNALHFSIAAAALGAGLHVISDKPATATLDEARKLARIVASATGLYGLTYTYSGYPMVRAARDICREGRLGAIRKIVVEYAQGWLAQPIEHEGDKQAVWRADPAQAGIGGCITDIGIHAFHLAEFVSGERIDEICPELSRLVPGRALDDDCNILLRLASGAKGVLHASQAATGARNGLRLRIWGENGGLDWNHETPDRLTIDWLDQHTQVLHAATPWLPPGPSRLPPGHPEGFIEAFANIYRDFGRTVRAGTIAKGSPLPTIEEGLRGMAFVAAATAGNGKGWTKLSCEGIAG